MQYYAIMCRAFLNVHYRFLLISNKFCDLSLLHWVPSLSPKAELWALEDHVHKTTYGPLMDNALYVMLSMRANPLLGHVGGGWALEISTFLGPKWHSPDGSMPFHRAQKSLNFQGQTSSTCPRNVSARIVRDRVNHRSINSCYYHHCCCSEKSPLPSTRMLG
jgi:hypothetical protein